MKKRIFITATNTDIGKTYTLLKLLELYAAKGIKVGAIKFVETGVVDGVYPDGERILQKLRELNPLFESFTIEDIVPVAYELPAAPYVASGGEAVDFEKLSRALEKMETHCDLVLIEGAGGLYVPLDYTFMMIDLISFFCASALLVTHCNLGCINDTLLSIDALEQRRIPYLFAFNCKSEQKEHFEDHSKPYFEKKKMESFVVDEDIETIAQKLLLTFEAPTIKSL